MTSIMQQALNTKKELKAHIPGADAEIPPCKFKHAIPYSNFLGRKLASNDAATLLAQCVHWARSAGPSFYKFIERPENSSLYCDEFDSWCDELVMTRHIFNRAFSTIGKAYTSRAAYDQARKLGKEYDAPTNSKHFCRELDECLVIYYFDRNIKVPFFLVNVKYWTEPCAKWQEEERILYDRVRPNRRAKNKDIQNSDREAQSSNDNSIGDKKVDPFTAKPTPHLNDVEQSDVIEKYSQSSLENNCNLNKTNKTTQKKQEEDNNIPDSKNTADAQSEKTLKQILSSALSDKKQQVRQDVGEILHPCQQADLMERVVKCLAVSDGQSLVLPGCGSLEVRRKLLYTAFSIEIRKKHTFNLASTYLHRFRVIESARKNGAWDPEAVLREHQEELERADEKSRLTQFNEMRCEISRLSGDIAGDELLLKDAKTRGHLENVKTFTTSIGQMKKRLSDLQARMSDMTAEDAIQKSQYVA